MAFEPGFKNSAPFDRRIPLKTCSVAPVCNRGAVLLAHCNSADNGFGHSKKAEETISIEEPMTNKRSAQVNTMAGTINRPDRAFAVAAKRTSSVINMSIPKPASRAAPALEKQPFTNAIAEITPATPKANLTAGTASIADRKIEVGLVSEPRTSPIAPCPVFGSLIGLWCEVFDLPTRHLSGWRNIWRRDF